MKKNEPAFHRTLRAFSLTELLIVLVIIGILVLLAYPALEPLIGKAHSTEAKLQLKHVYTLQKSHFMEFSKYSPDLPAIGFEQQKLTTEGGGAKYAIEIAGADITTFLARATAVVDFDGDGVLNVWEIDQEMKLTEVVKD